MKQISLNRHNAYTCFIKNPLTKFMYKDMAAFENDAGTLLGLIVLDMTDVDLSVVIHKRDEAGKFVFEDAEANFKNMSAAQQWLLKRVEEIEQVQTLTKKDVELFKPF